MKVAVIGGGCCGLTSVKACLEYGMEPVCFERTDDICGLWRFTEGNIEGKGSVAKSTLIKTSKEMSAFSDFPPPPEFPVYMHQEYVCKYFRLYADNFDLKKHVRFNTEVERISKADDFVENGRWKLKIKEAGAVTEEIYDAVMVCTGHHAYKHYVKFPGMDLFKGEVVHTHDYKYSAPYKNKTAVVVGVGNSGCDAAVDLCHVTSPVYLSTRRGAWVQKNIGRNGLPGDFVETRWRKFWASVLPQSWIDSIEEYKVNKNFDHKTYSIKPKHRISGQHPSLNDDLPLRLASGTVKLKPNIRRFTETGVEFDDGSCLENVDVVILATGYDYGYPFIDKDVVDIRENVIDFYLYEFLPDLEKQTMAFIGCYQPTGAIMPIAEMQCRYAMQVFKGEKILPNPDKMWGDIQRRRTAMKNRYVNTQRHTIQVDYVPFLDEMAVKVGCKPNLLKFALTDPVFFLKLVFGPCTAYQFRLSGPHPWRGAREAIENQWDRTRRATMVRDPPVARSGHSGLYALAVLALLLVVIISMLYR
ncbi:flavin-containing monooxygenase 5-like [Ostrea edulis]|uniref:flavin-containing monooxygenase 5-like n=1 Tax=Ostrea edulis TaxID=37623 RepID=UPI0024AF8DA8|nr:flavin-containing monooxygenase 5-like [Ostrea edulis]